MQNNKEAAILARITAMDSEAELLQRAETVWADNLWLMLAACYRKAAKLGSVEARYLLGECYEIGMGVMQSDADAVRWYTEAANQRHSKAMRALAEYDYQGI